MADWLDHMYLLVYLTTATVVSTFRAFKIHEFTAEFSSKLESVEKRLEGMSALGLPVKHMFCEGSLH